MPGTVAPAGGRETWPDLDRIIRITLGIFIIILVGFVAITGYSLYVENAYRSSLSSTYTYTLTITTDSPLSNLTLFVPVPVGNDGSSPVVSRLSSRDVSGVPETWTTELYDTGKTTLLKIQAPSLALPAGSGPGNPFSVTISTTITSKRSIDTRDPVANSAMFRPVEDLVKTGCQDSTTPASGGQCYSYLTPLYAHYSANENASVTVSSALTGKNEWKVFSPEENEYRTSITLLMYGSQKGWTPGRGYLEAGMGAYDAPSVTP